MGDDGHSGEKVLLYILVGVGLFGLAYLFWKDQLRRDNTIQTQSLGTGLGLGGRTASQFALSNPRIDELEKQTIDLEMQTSLLQDKLKLYDYKLSQMTVLNSQNSLNDIPRTYSLSNMSNSGQPARAGSVTTVRTTVDDKIRQKDFGMN